ncbi:HYC_CC_PP family protein [Pedobacter cryophilus]|uniref:Secreted protein n=1 Tax=Pedobacter cryophilus TaxID=2571271 RepID=A0A4U1BZF3_9SPHI|nr:hypothetical protein [Pedobacter cryophilus]TKB97911.1 hypothetical protein FA046_11230 [Pedobacter cryophilus]
MKIFRHSLILLLCLMVFTTSSGLTVNLHYCAGQLQNVSMKQDASDCMMAMPTSKVACDEKAQKTSLKKVDTCCQNQQIKAKSEIKITDTKAKKEGSILTSITFLKSYFISLFSFGNEEESDDQENDYSLFPLLQKGLYILFQQFRN